MRVLLVAENTERNTFILNLVETISLITKVNCSEGAFWEPSDKYDIVFLQWPERLSNRVGRKSFPPTKRRLQKISSTLDKWKQLGVKIIITRHNTRPHHYSTQYEQLYYAIYRRVDGVVHMADYSVNEFKTMYEDEDVVHTVIPHNGYWNVLNVISKEKAREKLNIDLNTKVILAFGSLRIKNEETMLLKAFEELPIRNKRLLLPRGYFNNENAIYRLMDVLRVPIYNWMKNRKARKLLKNDVEWAQEFVNEDDIQLYFNAADVLVLPRINTLNSGNLYLGLTFGKVICGPQSGNIGEVLKETGNPTFDPHKKGSITSALSDSLIFSKTDLGAQNYKYAMDNLSNEKLSKGYANFFGKILGNHEA